jgi:hypothetical protein
MRIECERCEMYESDHCSDCLVTALLHPGEAVDIDEDVGSSLRTLAGSGLIPTLKFRPRREDEPGAAEAS